MQGELVVEFHELANIFPLIEGRDFDDLVESIRANGQREGSPIILFEGKILDGRNRYRACKAAGVTPQGEDFEGTYEDARQFVIDMNLRRRHLDTGQRAMAAAKLATLGDGQRQVGKFANVPTQAEAAERLNVSERSVRDAVKVRDHGAPELVAAVEHGKVSVSRAARIADLPKEEQPRRIAEPKAERKSAIAEKADRYLTAQDERLKAQAPPPVKALRNLLNISGGELARWIKLTTPNNHTHVIRVLRMAADILEAEHEDR
jgi:ParB-like chromosome segregation protein Spo0J